MDSDTSYLTEEKRRALEVELKELQGTKRKEIIDALEYAKSLGDLAENAEYHQAREDQGKLEARILKIEVLLQSSKIVKKGGGGVVGIGSRVVVQKANSAEQKAYIIVGSEEANMQDGKISNRSPLGLAILGKKKGESISFEAPSGKVIYKVVSVS